MEGRRGRKDMGEAGEWNLWSEYILLYVKEKIIF